MIKKVILVFLVLLLILNCACNNNVDFQNGNKAESEFVKYAGVYEPVNGWGTYWFRPDGIYINCIMPNDDLKYYLSDAIKEWESLDEKGKEGKANGWVDLSYWSNRSFNKGSWYVEDGKMYMKGAGINGNDRLVKQDSKKLFVKENNFVNQLTKYFK